MKFDGPSCEAIVLARGELGRIDKGSLKGTLSSRLMSRADIHSGLPRADCVRAAKLWRSTACALGLGTGDDDVDTGTELRASPVNVVDTYALAGRCMSPFARASPRAFVPCIVPSRETLPGL
eukprot:4916111-Pyramimonas_sp.AAC.1